MSRIARSSVNGRLNSNTFCSGAEVVTVQCKRGLRLKGHSDLLTYCNAQGVHSNRYMMYLLLQLVMW